MGEQQLRLAMKAARAGTPDLWWSGSNGGWVYDKTLRLVFSTYKDAFCCVDFSNLPRDSKPVPVPIVCQAKGWQSVSKPPKEGAPVLVAIGACPEPIVARRDGSRWLLEYDRKTSIGPISFWRHPPKMPKSEATK